MCMLQYFSSSLCGSLIAFQCILSYLFISPYLAFYCTLFLQITLQKTMEGSTDMHSFLGAEQNILLRLWLDHCFPFIVVQFKRLNCWRDFFVL